MTLAGELNKLASILGATHDKRAIILRAVGALRVAERAREYAADYVKRTPWDERDIHMKHILDILNGDAP